MKDKDGKICVRMLEIKPANQSKSPKVRENSQRITKKYINEVATFGINSAKWEAANEYCKDRGWSFHIITEKELGLK
jgi:hypothetical protein